MKDRERLPLLTTIYLAVGYAIALGLHIAERIINTP
ncbi:hypothetical protein BI024_gp54 [Streptomyces phage Nanodon]|uniref:Uncharacterized protein n=1 Tax=Streptomyces phage Nanodon TaxID=1873777 RepID=A0A1B1PA74_9CAUD|nr:hypothetical protein BI024_gp54 [Streptomyces phage Nanodon]ANT41058.1 hypothetical protein SEA_NANODON_54 [Streptomyces phage Nanodon]